ncbi:protein of unknown function [Pedobacter sp. ok626]|uniref:DUF4843 domain-containing protein n=1 Tax=Pedobacter sp. ok626 TaxID=1761882 RepID=UPI000886E0CC|nr:DUF4843 domain-containing protein [Pedobacter sp. ok626]SDK25651.1 protein of unknown function [Pedobacter sp. ok626]
MKRITVHISVLLLLITMFSCKKQELKTYEGLPSVYFNETNRRLKFQGEVLTDSSVLSFSLAKVKDSVVTVITTTVSTPSSQDRTYELVIDPASTAIAGTHYDVLPKVFTIKKNTVTDTVRIKFFRTTDLQTKGVTLFFDLKPNENFSTPMIDKTINATTKQKISYIKYRYFINDIIKRPGRWLDGYLGKFSRKKLELMTTVLNVDPAYLDTSVQIGETLGYGLYMQRYLNEMRLAGKTVYEDDGTEMVMGPSAQ